MECIEKLAAFTSVQLKRYNLWSCQKVSVALHYLLYNIFYKIWLKIPIGSYCSPRVANLSLFGYERDFMLSLSDNNQAGVFEASNPVSRYEGDLLNIDNPYFEQMASQIYPTAFQLTE